jgi:hypothetical protein
MLLEFRRWMAAATDRPYYDLEKDYHDDHDYIILEPQRCLALGSGPKGEAIRHLLRQRQALMFMSTYQEEQDRFYFLGLPAELRNDIYRKTLFCPGPPEIWKLMLVGEQPRCQPLPRLYSFHEDLTISTLAMLSAVKKQIRNESQSLFWSTQKVEFISATMPQHIALDHFLTNIGPAARASIKELDRGSIGQPNYHSIRPEGCVAFQNLLIQLALCTNLRRLRFNVYILDIFLIDRDVLVSRFLNHESLQSPTLEKLANTLASLPRLEVVHLAVCKIKVTTEGLPRVAKDEQSKFLNFAFSGLRATTLQMAVYDRLKGSFRDAEAKRPRQSVAGGGKAVVWIDDFEHESIGEGSDIMNYEEWEKWSSDVVKKR